MIDVRIVHCTEFITDEAVRCIAIILYFVLFFTLGIKPVGLTEHTLH